MKDRFSYCLPLSEADANEIWENGFLTLDANVLLDLYRYHEDTRGALLAAFEQFRGRIWISNQTAEEFFRNRKKVIVSASNSFDEAERSLSELRKVSEDPLVQLKSNRIVPDVISDTVRASLGESLEAAQQSILEARNAYPDYLENDPILETLVDLLDEAVGDPFNEGDLSEAIAEGKRRKESKIPPGYLDSGKDGLRPYGDYFMWRQILSYSNEAQKPIIFVTSERKEDWWERAAGRITGLQFELVREVHDQTGQKLLAYRTDRFLEFSSVRTGAESSETAVKEIRAVAKAAAVAKAIVANTPAITPASQAIDIASIDFQSGILTINVIRPVFMFTCSGHLEPNTTDIPNLRATLVQHPSEMPQHIVRVGAGTTFDFNIHVKSTVYEAHLPVGEYVFEYEATVPKQNGESNSDET